MFNKYDKQCKVGEGHLISYFYKKSKIYKVCNDFKSNVCFGESPNSKALDPSKH
jgi:hypothetical protein